MGTSQDVSHLLSSLQEAGGGGGLQAQGEADMEEEQGEDSHGREILLLQQPDSRWQNRK